jgi:ANTAR domain
VIAGRLVGKECVPPLLLSEPRADRAVVFEPGGWPIMTRALNRRPVASQETSDLATAQAKIANLETALHTARTIGMAIGIVMERLKIPQADAFDVLVTVSHQENRRLRDIASDLVFTGELGHVPSHEHGHHRTADKPQRTAAAK